MWQKGQVRELCQYDPRIRALARERLGSGQLANYVVDVLFQYRGTFIVAKLILDALAPFAKSAFHVTRADVQRLGVHRYNERMHIVSSYLLDDMPGVKELVRRLQIQLMYDPRHVPIEVTSLDQLEGVPRRLGCSRDEEDITVYLRVFVCSLAMLVGVSADPRVAMG